MENFDSSFSTSKNEIKLDSNSKFQSFFKECQSCDESETSACISKCELIQESESEENSCDQQKRKKEFIKALMREHMKSNSVYDTKAYQNQLKRNETLKDQIWKQRGISAGVVLEAQNISQKISFQDLEIEYISKKINQEKKLLEELQCEFQELISMNRTNDEQRKLEIQTLQCELDRIHATHEQAHDAEMKFIMQGTQDISIFEHIYNEDIDSQHEEVNNIKYRNLQRQLQICLFDEEQKDLEEELQAIQKREEVSKDRINNLSSQIRSNDIEISKSKQELKHLAIQCKDFQSNITNFNTEIKSEEHSIQKLKCLLNQHGSVKNKFQQEVEVSMKICESIKQNIEISKSEVAKLRNQLEQQMNIHRDVFAKKC